MASLQHQVQWCRYRYCHCGAENRKHTIYFLLFCFLFYFYFYYIFRCRYSDTPIPLVCSSFITSLYICTTLFFFYVFFIVYIFFFIVVYVVCSSCVMCRAVDGRTHPKRISLTNSFFSRYIHPAENRAADKEDEYNTKTERERGEVRRRTDLRANRANSKGITRRSRDSQSRVPHPLL